MAGGGRRFGEVNVVGGGTRGIGSAGESVNGGCGGLGDGREGVMIGGVVRADVPQRVG